MSLRIFHNPRCSKSRATLALLEARGLTPEVVRYLDAPPDEAAIRETLTLLKCAPRELMRTGEAVYRELGLKDADDETLIQAMVANPILIERPIVFAHGKAAIGRPPEAVLEIL